MDLSLHIVEAKYLGGYKVEVTFNDGQKGIADLSAILSGPVFEPLPDPAFFAQLRVDGELRAIA
jgi:hypothetical protein